MKLPYYDNYFNIDIIIVSTKNKIRVLEKFVKYNWIIYLVPVWFGSQKYFFKLNISLNGSSLYYIICTQCLTWGVKQDDWVRETDKASTILYSVFQLGRDTLFECVIRVSLLLFFQVKHCRYVLLLWQQEDNFPTLQY